MPQVRWPAPRVDDRLRGRLPIHVEQHGILLRLIEAWRLEHPPIEHHAAADVQAEELARTLLERRQSRLELRIVLQHPHSPMIRQRDDLRRRWRTERRPGVHGIPPVW